MRQQFFLGLFIFLICGGVAYFCWLVLRSFYGMFAEWQSNRDLDDLEIQYQEIRQRRREKELQRLDNGCQHDYEDLLGAFPSGVCNRCGLSREKPTGQCDHVWRRVAGPIPGSRCEQCGETHGVDVASA